MKTYKPDPIGTSHILLSPDLNALIEQLSENNHDHWAEQRMSEGWQYGASRDDAAKKHPDLVPYCELTESEKEYDRRTVVEALRAIMALGYKVEKR